MNSKKPSYLPESIDFVQLEALIDLALREDLGDAGDVTTLAVIPASTQAKGVLLAKEDLVVAGLPVAQRVFERLVPDLKWQSKVAEGTKCQRGTILAELSGSAQGLLTAERTALNFLQRLSAVATSSNRCAEVLEGTKTLVLDTRKTTPGYRNLEKYAVRTGGGGNHRLGLYDRVMIKDNHRELAHMDAPGGIMNSVAQARAAYPKLEVEVEVDTLKELEEALKSKAEYILLDNMSDEMMAEAVKMTAGSAKLEASGGITLERLGRIGKLGVDFVSLGALTHSIKAADISLDLEEVK